MERLDYAGFCGLQTRVWSGTDGDGVSRVGERSVFHRVLWPARAVTMEELTNDEEYSDILEDMREECGKYGRVVEVRGACCCAGAGHQTGRAMNKGGW